jgi:hypothetical protein
MHYFRHHHCWCLPCYDHKLCDIITFQHILEGKSIN